MRVGITGGSGFVGGHIVAAFLDRGDSVVVLDPTPSRRSTEWMQGDVREPDVVKQLAADTDVVVHLAAVLGTKESLGNMRPSIDVNINGTWNVVEACADQHRPMVFATCGNTQMMNGYATTKRCAERFVYQARDWMGLPAAVVRPLNAYGPGQTIHQPFGPGKVRKVMPSFACAALSGMPIELYGGGHQLADTVWVGDIGRVFTATADAVCAGNVPKYAVEVGGPRAHSARELAELVVADVVERGYPPVALLDLPMRAGEMAAEDAVLTVPALERAVHMLVEMGVPLPVARQVTKPLNNGVTADLSTLAQVGVEPTSLLPLADGVHRTLDWYEDQEGIAWHRP